uniref:Uncharacterized protein n=1 Tax=Geospiza parvula TaxID=87175 RepID=A0A8C3N929_GEOPR
MFSQFLSIFSSVLHLRHLQQHQVRPVRPSGAISASLRATVAPFSPAAAGPVGKAPGSLPASVPVPAPLRDATSLPLHCL